MKPVFNTKYSAHVDSYTEGMRDALRQKGVPADTLNVGQALELQGQRMKYEPSNTPLTVIQKHAAEDEQIPFFIGDLNEAWDKLKEVDKIQGANWELSVLFLLSDRDRNLVSGFSLHSPEIKKLDDTLDTRADMLESREASLRITSRNVGQWRFLLEEFDRIPAQHHDKIISVGDIPNIIKHILEDSHDFGKVDGDPRIRLSLDGNLGIACFKSHFDDPVYRDLILEWVGSVVEFCKNNRHLYWNAVEKAYTPKHQEEVIPPSTKLIDILRSMA